MLNLVLMSAYF